MDTQALSNHVIPPGYNAGDPTADLENGVGDGEKANTPVEAQTDFADYAIASAKLKTLASDWQKEKDKTQARRRVRAVSVDVDAERSAGRLKQDETIIPIRTIDTNIRNELPPFIAYLKQSRRLMIFKDVDDPTRNVENIESEFTRVCQYDGWEIPHFKVLDGSRTHGWDWAEVVFDAARPGHAAIEHVAHEDLMFPLDAMDIQSCAYIARAYMVTETQLRAFVNQFDFDATQVNTLINECAAENSGSKSIEICKMMYKDSATGAVHVGWYSVDKCSDWLKAPAPLFLGIKRQEVQMVTAPVLNPLTGETLLVPQPQVTWVDEIETTYPYEPLYYYESEEPKIFDHKGRVYLDQYKQEAQTTIWSGFVNRITRASKVFSSPRGNNQAADGKPKLVSKEMLDGGLYDSPLEFWGLPYPDPSVINALAALDTQNAQETNQIAWAVNNRKDSRKTATEISAATQQTALLSGVQVTLYSVFIRRVYSRVWRIVQSRAQQGLISFLVNDPRRDEVLAREYQLFAAGDIDVVQRQEKLQRKAQFMSYVQGTPLAGPFLISMIKDAFPDEALHWEEHLLQMQNQAGTTQALAQTVIALAERFKDQIPPDQQKQILQVLDAVAPASPK